MKDLRVLHLPLLVKVGERSKWYFLTPKMAVGEEMVEMVEMVAMVTVMVMVIIIMVLIIMVIMVMAEAEGGGMVGTGIGAARKSAKIVATTVVLEGAEAVGGGGKRKSNRNKINQKSRNHYQHFRKREKGERGIRQK